MNTETKPETMKVDKGERYCPDCNTQVTQDAEVCPSCKKVLYAAGRPQLIGCLWGFLMGSIVAVIVTIFCTKIGKFNGTTLGTIVGLVVFFSVWHYKEAKPAQRRDLAVLKPTPQRSISEH